MYLYQYLELNKKQTKNEKTTTISFNNNFKH
jgi:hypothetical protein